jgi:hypothetical protein
VPVADAVGRIAFAWMANRFHTADYKISRAVKRLGLIEIHSKEPLNYTGGFALPGR